jgi:hypothetical protein
MPDDHHGLVDTFTTPRLLDPSAEGKRDSLPLAPHYFPLAETTSTYDTFAGAATSHALEVVLTAARADPPKGPARERDLVTAG